MATTAWDLRVAASYAVLLTLVALTTLVDSQPLTYVTVAVATVTILALALAATRHPLGPHPHLRS